MIGENFNGHVGEGNIFDEEQEEGSTDGVGLY